MKLILVLPTIIFYLLSACSSSKSPTNASKGGKTYNHLFILGNTPDISARVLLEKDLAAAVAAKGYGIIKSIDIFPPSLSDPKPPTKEQITDSLKATACDALFVMNLKRREDIKYNPGVKVNGTNTMLSDVLASSLGYRTSGENIQSVNKQGSYTYENGFYITCDLVDAKTQAIVYSATSEMTEYAKLNTFGKSFLTSLVEQLEKNKVLRK